MQWSDLEWVSARHKVARLTSAGDLRASSGALVLFPAGDAPPPPRDGIWVSTSPVSETVKRVDDAGVVHETVPREQLRIVGYPVVVPAALAQQATDPRDLLRRALDSGEARSLDA